MKIISISFFLLIVFNVNAAEIKIAVASNFKSAIYPLVKEFEKNTKHKIILSFASTGKHYAQIKNGAPFSVFLAADVKRAKLLEQQNIAIKGSRFTYAIGKLVLWSKAETKNLNNILLQNKFKLLAIANPRHAPYGKAAKEYLENINIWHNIKNKLIRGENINQTFQFADSGSVDLALIALSQVITSNKTKFEKIDENLYTPIKQQAVLLKNENIAKLFLQFIKSDKAKKIIKKYGYDTL